MQTFSMDLNYINSLFSRDKKKIVQEETSISSLAPKILTKKEDLEKVQPYLDKLKDTLNAKGVNNIALTGGYGSGKSTLLKTFQHWNNKEFNFLNISLAAFNQTKTKENFKDLYDLKIKNGKTATEAEKEISSEFKETLISNEELEKQLEISILQQIIYKVKPSKLPESRFKRIVNVPKWKLFFLIPFGFVAWLSSVVLLFKYNYLDNLNPHKWIFNDGLDWSSVFVFLFAFLGIGYFSKLVVELFSNSKINKVNLKGEIEIGDNSNKSILNEHYDEILYYFEQNNFNVLVIEDLDRFDNTNIFTKLRELNILLNNSDSIRNKPAYKGFGIKFLYAVGDDLFNDKKERVKFFEYIIPVIPFINSFNATEQLKTLIKESDLEENVFTKEFLSDITTFIDDIDMRLLINIFHEFVIYRNVLKPDVLKGHESELFAIITYKNIDPEDFNKLNNKEGKLYKLINDKKKYIQKLISKITSKSIDKETEIENINDENINNIEELQSIYLKNILLKLPSNALINIFNIKEDFQNIIEFESFKYEYYDSYYNRLSESKFTFNFLEIENEVNSDFNYKERVELIESKHNNRIHLLQEEIKKLKSEKLEIESWDLKQIFKEVDINEYLNNFSNNGLLRNLILEGHISENYNDYISLFHEVSITKEDKKFERNVKSGINDGFEYKLTHIENLIDNHIDLKYFKRDTILNFDLLNYLGKNYSKYSQNYNSIIELLSNEKEKSIEFIDQYVSNEKRPLQIFFEKLVENWKNFWEFIYSKNTYSPEKIYNYLELIIRFSKVDTIINNQNKKLLKEAIDYNPHFLSLIKNSDKLNYFKKISTLIEQLDVEFEELENPNDETKELFEFVFNNNHYEINIKNLFQMFKLYGEKELSFETANYSAIQNSKSKPLIEYINSNINIYVEKVYLKLEQNKSDNEDSLRELLNNKDLEDKLKIKIIQKVETIITDLSKVGNIEIKAQLLINYKISANWENIIDYYNNCEGKIDEDLIKYLNTEDISTKLSTLELSEEDEKFEESLLVCDEIEDEIYTNFLKKCYFKYPELSFEHLSENKAIGLANKLLTTTKSNYDMLKENFPDNHITLIEKDFDKFFEEVEDFETDEDDILMILKSDKITIDNRFKYISKITVQPISDSNAIAKKVGEIIISKSTKIEFEFNIIECIVKSLDSTENEIKFVNLYFTQLSNENIISLVKNIGYNYGELFVKQHKPLLNNNAFNIELLNKLRSHGLINSFDVYKKDNTKIKAVANY